MSDAISEENESDREAKALSRTQLINIIILSTAMFVLFTGFFTMAATAETVIRAYSKRTGNDING